MTITASSDARKGSARLRIWLSAPAFLSVLPTLGATTTSPRARARATVPSVQLSGTTTTRSGRLVWFISESRAMSIDASSLCAGTSTTRRPGPAASLLSARSRSSSVAATPDAAGGRLSSNVVISVLRAAPHGPRDLGECVGGAGLGKPVV